MPRKVVCGGNGESKEFDDADDFDQDEFADDDFADDSAYVADDVPFSLSPNMEAVTRNSLLDLVAAGEDDDWELQDSPNKQSNDLLY